MDRENFFKDVVGKKIRHIGWTDKEWFTPQKLRDSNFMLGIDENGEEVGFHISFGYNSEILGTVWICLEE